MKAFTLGFIGGFLAVIAVGLLCYIYSELWSVLNTGV